nr:MAG TPA: BRO family protein [Caudoviricetes sp.]
MNNELIIIDEREMLGKDFKMYGTYEEPLFRAKDVAEWLGNDPTQLKKMLDKVDEDEKVRNNITTLGGTQNTWFLTEDGLYEVLMQSRKPIAKEFKKQVKTVVKELRKTGRYDSIEQQIRTIEDEKERRLKLTIYELEKVVSLDPSDMFSAIMLDNKKKELKDYLQDRELEKVKGEIKDLKGVIENMVVIGDRKQFANEVNSVARATGESQSTVYSNTYKLLKDDYGIDLQARVRNRKEKIQNERLDQGKKPLSPASLKSKVNALVIADEENLWRELGLCLFEVKKQLTTK